MSLVDFCLRQCAMQALRGKTLAGDNVFDTPVDPITSVMDHGDQKITAIAIYTNLSERTHESREPFTGDSRIELTFQIYPPVETLLGGSPDTGSFSGRNAGGAFVQDLVIRQIQNALFGEFNTWSTLFKSFYTGIEASKIQSFVIVNEARKVEFSGREYMVRLETIEEPPLNELLGDPWQDFLTALRTIAEPGPAIATLFLATVEQPAGEVWEQAAAALGLTPESVETLGIGPARNMPNEQIPMPILQEIKATDEDGQKTNYPAGDGIVIDNAQVVTEP